MARKVMPVKKFVLEAVERALAGSEQFFGPIREDQRTKNLNYIYQQLTSGPPERFLNLLETTENPERIVEEADAKVKNFPSPYQVHPIPGDFLKERFDESLALQHAGQIIALIFGGPDVGSRFSNFNQDLRSTYAALKQMYEAALAEGEDGNGGEVGEVSISFNEPEKSAIIKQYSNALFSIHLLVRKISKPDENPGQYL